jgi:hypothetical protein
MKKSILSTFVSEHDFPKFEKTMLSFATSVGLNSLKKNSSIILFRGPAASGKSSLLNIIAKTCCGKWGYIPHHFAQSYLIRNDNDPYRKMIEESDVVGIGDIPYGKLDTVINDVRGVRSTSYGSDTIFIIFDYTRESEEYSNLQHFRLPFTFTNETQDIDIVEKCINEIKNKAHFLPYDEHEDVVNKERIKKLKIIHESYPENFRNLPSLTMRALLHSEDYPAVLHTLRQLSTKSGFNALVERTPVIIVSGPCQSGAFALFKSIQRTCYGKATLLPEYYGNMSYDPINKLLKESNIIFINEVHLDGRDTYQYIDRICELTKQYDDTIFVLQGYYEDEPLDFSMINLVFHIDSPFQFIWESPDKKIKKHRTVLQNCLNEIKYPCVSQRKRKKRKK